jgi:uncharacterized membrane protein YdbT with pleckstrin-like domain
MDPYVEKILIKDEQLVYTGRLSAWGFIWPIVLGIVLVPLVVGIFVLAWVWIRMRTVELAITTRRLIIKSGLVSRHTVELNLGKVESLQVDQNVLGRLLGFGSIQVNGTGTSHAPIHGVADPLEFRRQFMQAQDQAIRARDTSSS